MLRRLFPLVSFLPCLLAAQEPWAPPPMVEWPLLDLAVFHRPGGVEVYAAPSVGAEPVPDVRAGLVEVEMPAESLAPWLERARELYRAAADSAPPRGAPKGGSLALPGRDTTKILWLGYDRTRTRHLGLFFLSLYNSRGSNLWAAYGSTSDAERFLGALARPAEVAPSPLAASLAGSQDIETCARSELPHAPTLPRLRPPPGAKFGGRVLLQYLVDSTGRIPLDRVEVLLTSGSAYSAEARWVMERAKYRPARCDGRRVGVVVRQTIRFPPPTRGR